MQYIPSSFYNERKTNIDTLMFHCSALNSQEMIDVLNQNELSCHYIIDENGKIIQLVDESKRAWHGGIGFWRDIDTDINSHSIGIELCHPTLGQSPYPEKQINSLISLSKQIINRYDIKPNYIIGHSDSAPTRKADPGKFFPWEELSKHGIGLWYDLNKTNPSADIKDLLSSIGYDTRTQETLTASLYAFARHFFPELIDIDINIQHLEQNIYPKKLERFHSGYSNATIISNKFNLSQIKFYNNNKFIKTLQAVSYSFND